MEEQPTTPIATRDVKAKLSEIMQLKDKLKRLERQVSQPQLYIIFLLF